MHGIRWNLFLFLSRRAECNKSWSMRGHNEELNWTYELNWGRPIRRVFIFIGSTYIVVAEFIEFALYIGSATGQQLSFTQRNLE